MYYVLDYSICALVFLLVITSRFFAKRQFPNFANRLFSIALVCALLDILLDIVGGILYEHIYTSPLFLQYIINTLFYLLQGGFPAIMTIYVWIITDNLRRQGLKKLVLLLIPAAAVELLILTNCFTHLIFYVNHTEGYVHAPAFYSIYACTFFYLAVVFILLQKYRKRINRGQYSSILSFIIIVLAAALIQFFLPRYLLTGPAIALAITLIYLVTQKPEDMLDALSGTFNQVAMQLFLRDLIEEHRTYQIILIKLSNMYRIDRLLGFASGNQVMSDIGKYLMYEKKAKWVFRPASTRFVVVTRSEAEHDALLKDVRERFSNPWNIFGYEIRLFTTICSMRDTSPLKSAEEALSFLDTVTRELQRGSFTELDSKTVEKVNREAAVEVALLDALKNDGLEVYLQPLYSVKDGWFTSAEALLRFPHQGTMISPAEFIPIAERNMLILRLDELVMRKICEFVRQQDPQRTLGMHSLDINLSAAEFVYEGLADRMTRVIEEYGVSPSFLHFEITETAATNEFAKLQSSMRTLSDRGFRFLLDDYGTGFSNITRVVNLPFYGAKLDYEMLNARDAGRQNDIVYQVSVEMFQKLGFKTVAEGVETQTQAEQLTAMGVDYIQGYYYARPMPIPDFVRFMEREAALRERSWQPGEYVKK